MDLDLADVCLKQGRELVWLTEEQARGVPVAFGYHHVLTDPFRASRAGLL